VYAKTVMAGTSEYSGHELSFSALYAGGSVSLGLIVRPPSSVTRSFTATVEQDTTGSPSSRKVTGSDKMMLPWRGVAGIAFAVRENLSFAFEYEIRPLASAEYTSASGETSRPWLSSSIFRIGGEYHYADWLAIRAGYRAEAEVFEQVGNALLGEPVRYAVYSAGLGLTMFGVRLNAAYEYGRMKYQDMWQTNVNLNTVRQSTVVIDLSYVIR